MSTKLHLVLTTTILFLSFYGMAQATYWRQMAAQEIASSRTLPGLDVDKVELFKLERETFLRVLEATPNRNVANTVYFPDIKGELIPFQVLEAPLFSPELAAKYPGIKSYVGRSLKTKGDRVRFSVSHKGVQVMLVYANGQNTAFMEQVDNKENMYVVYADSSKLDRDTNFVCYTKDEIVKTKGGITQRFVDDQVLRKYRIAVSATGEYTNFHGGTVPDALAAINATLTRVNEVFETDLAVTLELIGNTDQVIYTTASTDPYDGNLNTQVQNTLTNVIGSANYDVGHLFHKAADNGNAGFIGSVCRDNQKGSAFSSAQNPQGDNFDLDYVAHELGHQFGANHTWSFESEGTQVQAEPASGTTIMGYAGIVPGNNVAPNGDDYFHYFSIVQIGDYLQTTSCAEVTSLSNTPPTIVSTGDFIIPVSTAFVLSGIASDPDAADVLTYAWEQIDDGVVTTQSFGPTNPSGANFRSLPPTDNPERYFPRLQRVLSGNLTQVNPPTGSVWETVSSIERDFNFALTVRDNAIGGGQSASDVINIRVLSGAGPFSVTSQTANENYVAGSVQTVNWDVANTNQNPINAQMVDIFLSTDGGLSFPIQLEKDVPNDGIQEILIPGQATTQARIMIKASNSIFFAVNTANFTIQESSVVLNFNNIQFDVCQPNDVIIPFVYETYGGFSETSTFSVLGAPAGLGITFSQASASADATDILLTVSNSNSVAPGSYPITVKATSATFSKEVDILLNVYNASHSDIILNSPADGSTNTSVAPLLEWEGNTNATSYELEIATNVGFNNIIETATVIFSSYLPTNLSENNTYFWRVKPINDCGEGTFSDVFSFRTIQINCNTKSANGLPITISSVGTPTVTSTVSFLNDIPVSDVNLSLDITHSFLADLVISLTSPKGTTVVLTSNSCGDLSNINATFDDEGPNFSCSSNPGISGILKPLGSLSSFNGESAFGEWTLQIMDTAPADGGSLNRFTLEICAEGVFRPDADNDGVFDDGDDLCLGTEPGTEVGLDGCPVFRFAPDNFTVDIQSESCRSNNDGAIRITANANLTYTVNVTGNGISENSSFTDMYSLENLMAGNYLVCITGTGGTAIYEEICFDIVVAEPQPLQVSSIVSLTQKLVSLTMTGAVTYIIELNGQVSRVEASEVSLNLKSGNNLLKVSTDLPCQGTYERQIFVSEAPLISPNPFFESTTLYLNTDDLQVAITIHSAHGQLLSTGNHNVSNNMISLDFIELPAGLYFVTVKGENVNGTYKVIKR